MNHIQTTDPSVRKERATQDDTPELTDASSFAPYLGEWELTVTGLPIGDMSIDMKVEPEGEKVNVTLSAMMIKMKIEIPVIKNGRLVFNYSYNDMVILPMNMGVVSDTELKGLMMNSYKVTGKRKK